MSSAVVSIPQLPAKRGAKAKSEPTKVAKKTSKKAVNPTRPPTGEMVNAAITSLKERKGSSLQAIKKYIGANYTVDIAKLSIYINKYLNSAVEKGVLVRTKGAGAAGSFKLVIKGAVKRKSTDGTPKSKIPSGAKKPVAKKLKKVPESKSPSKTKKTGRAPAAKPKAPKPKKATPKKTKK